jgi:hypothetical protein
MAYVLSTPTRRSAVSVTQAVYLALSVLIMTAVTCGVKVAASYAFLDKVNLKQIIALYIGMYALLLAIPESATFRAASSILPRILCSGRGPYGILLPLLGYWNVRHRDVCPDGHGRQGA